MLIFMLRQTMTFTCAQVKICWVFFPHSSWQEVSLQNIFSTWNWWRSGEVAVQVQTSAVSFSTMNIGESACDEFLYKDGRQHLWPVSITKIGERCLWPLSVTKIRECGCDLLAPCDVSTFAFELTSDECDQGGSKKFMLVLLLWLHCGSLAYARGTV